MEPVVLRRAVDAAQATASVLGLRVEDALVIHNSDRIAVRLMPCNVLARVAPTQWRVGMEFEAEIARRLAEIDGPVGVLDPRVEAAVYLRDGFSITLWTYYEPVNTPSQLEPIDFADALGRFHASLRKIDLDAPPISDRLAGWTASADDPDSTPELTETDRELVTTTLRRVSATISVQAGRQQLLHGEPHSDNVLNTTTGPRFIDLGTCQRGPIEYDLSYAPEGVAEQYPGADQELVHQFVIVKWAGIATMRWNRNDQFPNRDYWRVEALTQLRVALDGA